MYGAGLENIGVDGNPEVVPMPEDPADDQLLVRVDCVGMCFSDVKLIRQGGSHAKLYNRDLSKEPTRLGHEATLTILAVGDALKDDYTVGERYAVQPDIYQQGRSTAYGYTIPGGLIQYHLVGPEVLSADDGAYVLPIKESLGYAEAALTEPWACVEASYTQRRRLSPLAGGTMWIVGQPGDETDYTFADGVIAPSKIIATDISEKLLKALQASTDAQIVECNAVSPDSYAKLSERFADGQGFDDIIMLAPTSADAVTEAGKLIAFRGTLNIVGTEPLDGNPMIDVGRLHYHYTAFVGTNGTEITASYGEARNRCELQAGGTAVFIGAGGPMGQMHVQRAIELPNGPQKIIATEISDLRLETLAERFGPLAEAHGKELVTFNPQSAEQSTVEFVKSQTGGEGADDVVVSVPVPALMAEGGEMMNANGMLVLFAGVKNGSMAPLKVSDIYLHNAQFTGTSGSKLSDQQIVIDKTLAGELSPNRSVAAVGGMRAAHEGIEAMMTARYAGKVIIFPQIEDLALQSVEELAAAYPDIGALLGPNDLWTKAAEDALLEKFAA